MTKVSDIIIAHRGESFDAPENTLASVNLAWKNNVKSVEIDIQLTRDNEIVVIHDYDTLRVSGTKKVIKKSSLKELKSYDIGSYKDIKWKNERIPTLKEVIQTVPSDGKLIIEIKSDESILEKLKLELDQSKLKNSQIEIIAFDLNTIAKAKKLMPEYKMLWLLDLDYYWPHWMLRINKQRIIRIVKRHNLDGVNVWGGKILNRKFIEKFRNAGLLVYTWTVNKPTTAERLLKDGINGITTDRAAWLTQQLKNI